MISFWRIFWLELVALTRSKTVLLLTAAAAAWMLAFPCLLKGDGTAEGARALSIHYSLGGVFALLVVALLASATGCLASERTARRLQLTMVRPVRYFAIAFGKILAQVAVGAFVLAVACVILAVQMDVARPCRHVLSPVLQSPREEAKSMYEVFMSDPDTPAAAKRAKKEVVLRLLTQRAIDHYQTIPTNSTVKWEFGGLEGLGGSEGLSVRMRFTNQFEMRQDVVGDFRLGDMTGLVSNMTQAVLTVPLSSALVPHPPSLVPHPSSLTFFNRGKSALMLRPRQDIHLLAPADAFGWNLLRAYLGMVSVLMLVVSAGVFLSASLARPVALFVAFVVLVVSEMSPSVVQQYPDELESGVADRIGLYITRFAAEVTRPISSLSPLESLANDECVEQRDLLKTVCGNVLFLPVLLSLLAAFILPRKQEE